MYLNYLYFPKGKVIHLQQSVGKHSVILLYAQYVVHGLYLAVVCWCVNTVGI